MCEVIVLNSNVMKFTLLPNKSTWQLSRTHLH